MDTLTEDHLTSFMTEEWLVKVDAQKSTPYLFKFHHSTRDLSCVTLVTDTKTVWVEVLNSQQFARRWRSCNPTTSPAPYAVQADEDSWRETTLELLSNAHTLGAIPDIPFEVVESNFSDFAFELELTETLKWRWETNAVGHHMSSEIISKQLVMPLICANHIALASPEAFSGMEDSEVEKAVDQLGRTARRALDNHVKNALTKPRTSTILRRISAMFSFASNLPPIFSTAEKPDLNIKTVELSPALQASQQDRSNSYATSSGKSAATPAPATRGASSSTGTGTGTNAGGSSRTTYQTTTTPLSPSPPAASAKVGGSSSSKASAAPTTTDPADGSETENSSDEKGPVAPSSKGTAATDTVMRSPSPRRSTNPREPTTPPGAPSNNNSDSDSAPAAAPSRATSAAAARRKRAASSSTDDDSDDDAAPRRSQPAVKRGGGARQPVKRGGKRF